MSYDIYYALGRVGAYQARAYVAEMAALENFFGRRPTIMDICRYMRGETCLAILPETRRVAAARHALAAVKRAINARKV